MRVQWGHLVRTGVVKRDFRQISINNVITLGTRVRIVVLKVGCFYNLWFNFLRELGVPVSDAKTFLSNSKA